jgi:CMP-N-acetylneuraminic acid synthetase
MQPVVEHTVAALERNGWSPELVVLLQPTAPFRRGEHIRKAVTLLRESGASSVVTVVEIPPQFAPHYAMKIVGGKLVHFTPDGPAVTRRQDVEPAYSRDGTVYAVRRDVVMLEHDLYGSDCRPLVLPRDESVNLDTEDDWAEAERRLAG